MIVSGAIALSANYLWYQQQRADFDRGHREALIADEELRQQVRERRTRR